MVVMSPAWSSTQGPEAQAHASRNQADEYQAGCMSTMDNRTVRLSVETEYWKT